MPSARFKALPNPAACHPPGRRATLAYTLPDPTGTSLLLVNAESITQGYVLYDGYGKVLSSTLTPELGASLSGQGAAADPDTGLVCLGDNRFISPDTLVPQPAHPHALNRLAYVKTNPP